MGVRPGFGAPERRSAAQAASKGVSPGLAVAAISRGLDDEWVAKRMNHI